MLATMMIPSVLFLIPTYVLIYNLGWVGQFQSLDHPLRRLGLQHLPVPPVHERYP